jgi:vacuolar-type H+-ATPase subunit H
MSTEYTETLKKIKETEESSNKEVAEKKRALEEELKNLEVESDRSIAAAKRESEDYVAAEVEKARKAAQAQADALLASGSKQAETVANKKIDSKELSKIIDQALLSGFKGE